MQLEEEPTSPRSSGSRQSWFGTPSLVSKLWRSTPEPGALGANPVLDGDNQSAVSAGRDSLMSRISSLRDAASSVTGLNMGSLLELNRAFSGQLRRNRALDDDTQSQLSIKMSEASGGAGACSPPNLHSPPKRLFCLARHHLRQTFGIACTDRSRSCPPHHAVRCTDSARCCAGATGRSKNAPQLRLSDLVPTTPRFMFVSSAKEAVSDEMFEAMMDNEENEDMQDRRIGAHGQNNVLHFKIPVSFLSLPSPPPLSLSLLPPVLRSESPTSRPNCPSLPRLSLRDPPPPGSRSKLTQADPGGHGDG